MNSKLIISLFAVTGALGVGCGGSDTTPQPDLGAGGGSNKSQYASNTIHFPTGPTDVAVDLDGDGSPDNRLGQIIALLKAGMINAQTVADSQAASGDLVFLFEEDSSDATQQSATGASVQFASAVSAATDGGTSAPPDYMNDPSFTAAASGQAKFVGNIKAGVFADVNFADPSKTTTPITATLNLPLVQGQAPVTLPLATAYIQFTVNAAGDITVGQVDGAVKQTDIDTIVVPQVAMLVTAELQAGDTALATFDTDHNGTVSAAEIEGGTIGPFLKGDVKLFDANGNYKPDSSATSVKDSLSVGVGFTGVKATWK